ncbi:MAG: hypothetical protein BWX61_00856 [Bacteroidetes bacterium ADurb.Bin035]|nr:MAG: hypothetical protein BWX61_00856 [Bacteroidetes bacterium ADurb.Bin035]
MINPKSITDNPTVIFSVGLYVTPKSIAPPKLFFNNIKSLRKSVSFIKLSILSKLFVSRNSSGMLVFSSTLPIAVMSYISPVVVNLISVLPVLTFSFPDNNFTLAPTDILSLMLLAYPNAYSL